jgi:hypothetical protein
MSRILVLVVVGVLLFGAPLAADQMLQNDDVAVDTGNQTTQDDFAETGGQLIEATPILLAALVVGTILAAVRRVG